MPKIIRFHETGGADVLKIEDLSLTEPGEGEIRIKVEAISLSRADVMFRQGQYLEEPNSSRLYAVRNSKRSREACPRQAVCLRRSPIPRAETDH